LAVLLAALSANCRFAVAAADRSADDNSAVQSATYSTGRSGGRLKWIAVRPEAAQTASEVTPVQYVTPSPPSLGPSKSPTPLNRNPSSPVPADRFGDNPTNHNNTSKQPLLGKELERQIPAQQHEFTGSCPSPKDLKRISEIGTNIAPSEGELPRDCPLGNEVFRPRSFSPITFTWTASALCHKPLYFEDVQLERYGHMAGPWLQPFASGVNFFLTIPILPYKMGLELPNECMYTLGYYRPGDCAPYLFDPLPISVRGAFFEAGAWVGACAAFP
jgi:hypothetical protein